MDKIKKCKSCLKWKYLSDFHPRKQCAMGVRPECRECRSPKMNKTRREYYKKAKSNINKINNDGYARNATKRRERNRKHYGCHKTEASARSAKRRANLKRATPKFDQLGIVTMYNLRDERNGAGENCHVDHIIPLHNPLVCGLHVAHNLQVITQKENDNKSNKFDIEEHSYR